MYSGEEEEKKRKKETERFARWARAWNETAGVSSRRDDRYNRFSTSFLNVIANVHTRGLADICRVTGCEDGGGGD